MDLTGLDNPPVCLYCKTYQRIIPDYPVNPAEFNVKSEVPRCQFHSQYRCDHCDKSLHFNGISWCHDCQKFTCLRCGDHRLRFKKFVVYDHYYAISCKLCGDELPSLEFAEIIGRHPYQVGDLWPEGVLQVWLPLGGEVDFNPELKQWGNTRLRKMTVDVEFEPVDEMSGDSKQVWDTNAEIWKNETRSGDVNHTEIIIPKMLEFMDPSQRKVMDAACGEGTFTRKVAGAGFDVTGTDVSKLVEYAIETENEQELGIDYKKVSIHELKSNYPPNSFDQVTCNMAIMDIDNLDGILENIRYILKPGGHFVFSITHPIIAWPVAKTIKLPSDSQKNADKGWIIDRYLDEQPAKIHLPDMPSPMLYYPRMISTYINTLQEFGFSLLRLSEPKPSEEIILKYPRDMYNDYDRNPIFMIFKTRLVQ